MEGGVQSDRGEMKQFAWIRGRSGCWRKEYHRGKDEMMVDVINKLPPPSTHDQEPHSPNYSCEYQMTVNMACEGLELNDYPVPISQSNKDFFKIWSNFESYFLPLACSVNVGAHPLEIKTLVKAKWFEVLQAKEGEASPTIYFNKPSGNKVKVNVL